MENSKKDYSLAQMIIEQFVTKAQADVKKKLKFQAEVEEMLKTFVRGQNTGANAVQDKPNWELNEERIKLCQQIATINQANKKIIAKIEEIIEQLGIGQNTGAKAVVDVPNCDMNEDCVDNRGADAVVDVPSCELNEEREVKEATLCFRVGGEVENTFFVGIEDVKWFAIDGKGCVSPYIEEPPCHGVENSPLSVGRSVFLISDVIIDMEFLDSEPFRVVHYLDMQKVYEKATPWKKASSLIGEYALFCHFLVANNKIYACGFLKKDNNLCMCYFDCLEPDQGWNIESCSPTGSLESFTIEFVTTDGKPGRRARSALIFSKKCLLSYEFRTGSLKEYEVFPFNEICCSHYYDRGIFYLLIIDSDGRFCLVVYNHHDSERDYTQVLGLDGYLPEDNKRHPELKLVHLGNERLCLVWPLVLGAKIEVRCTKFFVELLDEEYRATNVFSQVHTVEGFSLDNFEAVVVSSDEKNFKIAEDDALGLGAEKGKTTTGANSDCQISK